MKKLLMTGLIAAAAFSLPVAMANDYKSETDRTADNQGVVVLSGTAPTKDASDLAAMLAKDTEGVTRVHNKIVVAE
jgi:osmotically-inducible protein OsmY